ncbi:MAG: CHAT domain-containing protein [bacterium]|nr:CHAT domain-containing protein [bacterium]
MPYVCPSRQPRQNAQRLLAFLLLAWAALGTPACAPEETPSHSLAGPIVRQLAGDEEPHVHDLELAAGRYGLVAVEQRGIDVVVEVAGSDGRSLATVNAPTYRGGTETLLVAAEVSDTYHVKVRSRFRLVGPGQYTLRIWELSAVEAGDRIRIEAEAAMTEAGKLYFRNIQRDAIEKYQEALSRWRALGKKREEAQALYSIAVLYAEVGDFHHGLEFLRSALPLWKNLGERVIEATILTEIGHTHFDLSEYKEAQATLDQALALHRALGNGYGEAMTLNLIGMTSQSRGELRDALRHYEDALALLRTLGELEYADYSLRNIGLVCYDLGEPKRALKYHEQACEHAQASGDRTREASSLNDIGVVYRRIGRSQEALTYFDRALEILSEVEGRRLKARVLNSRGFAYYSLGDTQQALLNYRDALPLREAAGDLRGKAVTLSNIGLAHFSLGKPDEALTCHKNALDLRREIGDRRGQATALYQIGRDLMALGDLTKALGHFDDALDILRTEVGDPRKQANALHERGEVYRLQGRTEAALESLNDALTLRREVWDRNGEAQTLRALAQSLAVVDRDREARDRLEQALAVIESMRAGVAAPNLRAVFLSSQRRAYELSIDLLMKAHAAEPDRGHAQAALGASERARARSLLDLLHDAGADIHQGTAPGLRKHRSSLLERLNAQDSRRREAGKAPPPAAAERELESVLNQLDEVEAEIRRSSPRYGALTQATLNAQEIHSLLDPDTMLLEYALGEERSFLWAMTPSSFASFELPGREQIEIAARRVYEQLSTRTMGARKAERKDAAALSDLLLGPVAERLDSQRLVIVADGALHYIPFAALPVPVTDSSPTPGLRRSFLIERHEVVHLPSASALAAQRRQPAARRPASKWVAVLADPVFSPSDSRLRNTSVPGSPPGGPQPDAAPRDGLRDRAVRETAAPDFYRLPSTRREAEAIAALAPAQVLKALGFDASRALALGGELSEYHIVHFATHGVIDAQNPEESRLVLSRFDEAGKPHDQAGSLWLRDLYTLEWDANLVVLSGCETALGQELRGEGLVGLTRGFMYAGVPRVVASLWRIQDRVTAELMTRFYRSVLKEWMRPAAALREAQLSILRERDWADPYYWAAFVLQGDWRFSEDSSKIE